MARAQFDRGTGRCQSDPFGDLFGHRSRGATLDRNSDFTRPIIAGDMGFVGDRIGDKDRGIVQARARSAQ